MDRGTILKNLEWNRKAEDTTNAVIGCVQTVNQCGQSLQGWLDRKPDRRRLLRQLIKGRTTQKGRKVLGELIDYTISVVEARKWVKKFWVGALPLHGQPIHRSPSHIAAMQVGRQRLRDETKRQSKRRDR